MREPFDRLIQSHRIAVFLRESLAIEGIDRLATPEESDATQAFLIGPSDADTVIRLQAVYTPGKPLRDQIGMDVRVGRYLPPKGNPYMREQLKQVLSKTDPWGLHVAFETLHPFMDGNGRTGRTVWAWAMLRAGQDPFDLPFLHRFYYQTLERAG